MQRVLSLRRQTKGWLCFLLMATFLLFFPKAGHAAPLPKNWKELPASDFLKAVQQLPIDPAAEVVSHAWSQFLNDPEFVASADWTTVCGLVGEFGHQARPAG